MCIRRRRQNALENLIGVVIYQKSFNWIFSCMNLIHLDPFILIQIHVTHSSCPVICTLSGKSTMVSPHRKFSFFCEWRMQHDIIQHRRRKFYATSVRNRHIWYSMQKKFKYRTNWKIKVCELFIHVNRSLVSIFVTVCFIIINIYDEDTTAANFQRTIYIFVLKSKWDRISVLCDIDTFCMAMHDS